MSGARRESKEERVATTPGPKTATTREREDSEEILYYNIVTTKRDPSKRQIRPRDYVSSDDDSDDGDGGDSGGGGDSDSDSSSTDHASARTRRRHAGATAKRRRRGAAADSDGEFMPDDTGDTDSDVSS
eukprot:TRINITY_DN472_c0_g1_i4.p2 TRINITY_DN472_c0_g1~~TRINITY_DN472_c0_g1_i4.p2  ORF type:complete len:129 (-),score=43.37 TRINITY_DN472_c0_g1_i4:43-429(-)